MSGATPTSNPAARCVLWHPRGSPPPNDLIDAIQRRNLSWTATDRRLAAIVQTLAAPAPAAGTTPVVPTVLVLIDPPRLAGVDEVLDVVSRYRPRTALWVFDLADPTRLRSMQALEIIAKYGTRKPELSSANSPPPTPSPSESSFEPTARRLQLTATRNTDDTARGSARDALDRSASPISPDDLHMLTQLNPAQSSGFRSVY